MRKIIAIGESSYDIIFENNAPLMGFPGSRILNATASVANVGVNTTFISECAADYLGDRIVDFLESNGVNTRSVDRFTEGTTANSIIYETGRVRYDNYPQDRFDVVWPRIDEDDIIIFGSFYSVDNALRERLFEIIKYAQERKAIIIYLPGFHRDLNFRITKVMTAILENLEVSNIVIADSDDISNLFGEKSSDTIFRDKVEFYCPNFVYLSSNREIVHYASSQKMVIDNCTSKDVPSLGWKSGFVAGVAYGLLLNNITLSNIKEVAPDVWDSVIRNALQFAASADNATNVVTGDFATVKETELKEALERFNE
ncbi:MAG: carbohydrate kinase family protein [Muribaculaceae bacterium]|nr:carbohydrate kinase family protein [Muribaculaceae bacterium]